MAAATSNKKLLEVYSVGAALGEGAFGVVRTCTQRSTGEEFAVKMIDKVESPIAAILAEAEMLRSLSHPNIVSFVEVFVERCFVCIVMKKYAGGDMVDGLQSHIKSKGLINVFSIKHISHQIVSSVNYLHDRKIMHRDIKGDNFMMDRRDMTNPDCLVVLVDFGTAVAFKDGERFSGLHGTRQFWAPEVYDKNYGPKMDVWSLGVLQYGLATGCFPFRDERDIRSKEPGFKAKVDSVCQEFIRIMLKKKETDRVDSKGCVNHPWIAALNKPEGVDATKTITAGSVQEADVPGMTPEGKANVGVQDRREELLDRLECEHAGKKLNQGTNAYLEKSFKVQSRRCAGQYDRYAWWTADQVQKSGLLSLEANAKPVDPSTQHGGDLRVFKKLLKGHGIDTSRFGHGGAKTLEELAAQVRSGTAVLMLDATAHRKLVRVVDITLLHLFFGSGGKKMLLIETSETLADGRQANTSERWPATAKAPHENVMQATERYLSQLGIGQKDATFDFENLINFEEETDSPSYPGVRTVYRKDVISGHITVTDPAVLAKIGLPGGQPWVAKEKSGRTLNFAWMTESEVKAKNLNITSSGGEVSALIHAPIGMGADELTSKLVESHIDVNAFGKGEQSKSLDDFSAELIRGESMLTKGPSGLFRTVNVVVVIFRNPKTGETLVQTSKNGKDMTFLPGNKCRPDENFFSSARRVITGNLEISENKVQFQKTVRMIEEEQESKSYPMLRSLYRKYLVYCELV